MNIEYYIGCGFVINSFYYVEICSLYTHFGKRFFFNFYYLFIYLWLCWVFVFCVRAFSSCGKRGSLFITVRRPLIIAASLVAEHRLQMRRLSNCGSWAQLLHGMWDLPRPGLEPVAPALAGRFSTTAPPEKPGKCFYREWMLKFFKCFFGIY